MRKNLDRGANGNEPNFVFFRNHGKETAQKFRATNHMATRLIEGTIVESTGDSDLPIGLITVERMKLGLILAEG